MLSDTLLITCFEAHAAALPLPERGGVPSLEDGERHCRREILAQPEMPWRSAGEPCKGRRVDSLAREKDLLGS